MGVGEQPAFPVVMKPGHDAALRGMTQRTYIATAVLAGALSGIERLDIASGDYPGMEWMAALAVKYADALLKELGE